MFAHSVGLKTKTVKRNQKKKKKTCKGWSIMHVHDVGVISVFIQREKKNEQWAKTDALCRLSRSLVSSPQGLAGVVYFHCCVIVSSCFLSSSLLFWLPTIDSAQQRVHNLYTSITPGQPEDATFITVHMSVQVSRQNSAQQIVGEGMKTRTAVRHYMH